MRAKLDDFEIPDRLLQMVTLQLGASVHISGEALSDNDRQLMRDELSRLHEGQAVSVQVVSGDGGRWNGPEVIKKIDTEDANVGDGRKLTFHIFLERSPL